MSELYVLDTDCFTLFQFGHEQIVAHASTVDRLAITIVTVDESLTGWYSRVRQSKTSEQLAIAYRGLHKTVDALRHMEVLPYSQLAIEAQLRLRQQFRHLGKMAIPGWVDRGCDVSERAPLVFWFGSDEDRHEWFRLFNRVATRCDDHG